MKNLLKVTNEKNNMLNIYLLNLSNNFEQVFPRETVVK